MTEAFIFPAWHAMHPFIIHFPIGLLLITPLFILIGAAMPPPKGRPWMVTALVLMALGTASLFIAVPSGEAAARILFHGTESPSLLEAHQRLAMETRGTFVMLLAIYVSVLLIPVVLRQQGRLLSTVLPVCFLLLYLAGATLLVNTARAGTELAHPSGNSAISMPTGRPCGGAGS